MFFSSDFQSEVSERIRITESSAAGANQFGVSETEIAANIEAIVAEIGYSATASPGVVNLSQKYEVCIQASDFPSGVRAKQNIVRVNGQRLKILRVLPEIQQLRVCECEDFHDALGGP